MPDLKDQIRAYYMDTTTPIDVDSLLVDADTVLIGPFPDAALRRSAVKTMQYETPQWTPWWRGPRAAAFALVATVAVVLTVLAVVRVVDQDGALVGDGADDPAAALAGFVENYNTGDVDTVVVLFADDAVIEREVGGVTARGAADIASYFIDDLSHEGTYEMSEIDVSGNTVTFRHTWSNGLICFTAAGHEMAIESGLIILWTWPPIIGSC